MEKDLKDFNENIKFINKELCQYEDEKGNRIYISPAQLLINCEYAELDKKQFNVAKFKGEIDRSLEYEQTTTTRKIDKAEKTGNKRDRGTLIDEEVDVYKIWFLRNNLKLVKSYNNKEEALKYLEEFNKQVMKQLEV